MIGRDRNPREPVAYASAMDCERAFYQAFAERDVGGMDSVWADTDVICIHPGAAALRTRDEVLESWAAMFEDALAPRIRVHILNRVHDGGLAVHLVHEQISHAERTSHVLATNVFRRLDGSWRMISHHGSIPAVRRETGAAGASLH